VSVTTKELPILGAGALRVGVFYLVQLTNYLISLSAETFRRLLSAKANFRTQRDLNVRPEVARLGGNYCRRHQAKVNGKNRS
jgi:hypothetical protein